MSTGYVVVLALICGVHAASWGGFKDTPFEGFKVVSFLRSIVVAVVTAVALATLTDLDATLDPILIVGLLYAVERLGTELWKSFIREDDQSAYAIPMRIAVLGRTVDGRLPRYLTGVVVLLGVVLMGVAAAALQPADDGPLWLLLAVGGIGGWLTAVGGAWKDAPVEGFSGWKFLRSPAVATAWTAMLLPFSQDWVVLSVAAAGLSVVAIETYKTFFTGGRPPGKFDHKPVRPFSGVHRDRCRLLHSGAYLCLAFVTGMAALLGAEAGLTPRVVSLVVLTVVAALVSALVAANSSITTRAAGRTVGTDAVAP